jgi:glycerophosphoryl diester phosphodiesterase
MNMIDMLQKLLDSYFSIVPRLSPGQESLNQTKVIAHRGVHDNKTIIENTYDAFDKAIKLNLWGIEFDIHESADNIFIVNHDPTLKRLWGVDKKINQLSDGEIQSISNKIPRLDKIIASYGKKLHLFIELKAPFNNEAKLFEQLKELTPCEDYHLLSLTEKTFAHLKQFPRKCLLLVPEINNVKQFCTISINEKYGGVLGHYLLMTNKIIQAMKEKNQTAGVGFIESKNSLYREINRGLEWIFTNSAEQIINYIPIVDRGANSSRR